MRLSRGLGAIACLGLATAAFIYGSKVKERKINLSKYPARSTDKLTARLFLVAQDSTEDKESKRSRPLARRSLVAEVKDVITDPAAARRAIRDAIEYSDGITLPEDSVLVELCENAFGFVTPETLERTIAEVRTQCSISALALYGDSLVTRSRIGFYTIEIDMPVYVISDSTGEIREEFVSDFSFGTDDVLNGIDTVSRTGPKRTYSFCDLGTTIFPSRELAEEQVALLS